MSIRSDITNNFRSLFLSLSLSLSFLFACLPPLYFSIGFSAFLFLSCSLSILLDYHLVCHHARIHPPPKFWVNLLVFWSLSISHSYLCFPIVSPYRSIKSWPNTTIDTYRSQVNDTNEICSTKWSGKSIRFWDVL